MKIQLFILSVFVVATLGQRFRNSDDENEVRVRHHGGRRQNQIAENVEDAGLEGSISSEDITERNVGKGCGNGWRRGERRRIHGIGFKHDEDWHKAQGIPMPDANSEAEGNHHRHHHHHHHHRNHTTPTTTTTTGAPSNSREE